jgi:hypothetical protein
MKRSRGMTWWYGGGFVAVLFTIFPLYLMVKISVSPPAVDRVLNGAFREIVYEGKPVQATLDRYHLQLQQAQKRSK